MTLTIDRTTGEAWIENRSDESILWDAYEIKDEGAGGRLDPVNWRSFEDFVAEDAATALQVTGSAAWFELFAGTSSLVEGNFSDITAPPGYRVPIGTPFAQVFEDGLVFHYNDLRLPSEETLISGEIHFVGEIAAPWLNPANANDVNENGAVTPQDVIILVNSINELGSRVLAAPSAGNEPPPYLDPTGDNEITPADVISVVNEINQANSLLSAVPEPGSLGLAAMTLAAAACAWRRRLI